MASNVSHTPWSTRYKFGPPGCSFGRRRDAFVIVAAVAVFHWEETGSRISLLHYYPHGLPPWAGFGGMN